MTLTVKSIVVEDFLNYKEPSMFIIMPYCNFKCCKDAGIPVTVCQNYEVKFGENHEIEIKDIIEKYYLSNPITKSIVFGGLEPLDSFSDLLDFIWIFRDGYKCNDTIVIYTGYNEDEVPLQIHELSKFKNIIIKFGRYVPDEESHYDSVLGVNLVSNNQYGKKIS